MKGLIFSEKIISFLLAVLVIFTFTCCDNDTPEETTAEFVSQGEPQIPGGSLSVPYSSTDSLNPYYCTTLPNRELTSLIYRSLYRIDSEFTAQRDLAVSENFSGLTLKVNIAQNLVFSDSSILTAADVVYSFECAKKSDIYGEVLKCISSCSEINDTTVVFKLNYFDANVLNALYFPIVKKGTASTDGFLPIGNGFYQYNQDGIRLTLKANLKYAGALPQIGTVRLTDIKGNLTPENLVSTEELDFYYSDLSDAKVSQVDSSVTNVYLNNLVYLGINHENVNLVLADFRKAISSALDRVSLVENAFFGYARGAVVPFNTSWTEYSKSISATSLSFSADKEKVRELFSKHGFGEGGNTLNLRLLCNESNAFMRNTANFIANALFEFNVNVEIFLLSSKQLENAVIAGEYDLYLAEIKIPATMDLSQFFTIGGNAAYGINFENLTINESYEKYRNDEMTIDDFISVFNNEMPFVPLVYRNGRLCYTRNVISHLQSTQGNIYGEINKWMFADR